MKKNLLISFLILTLSFLSANTVAENSDYHVRHLGIAERLSNPHITSALVDNNGRLWVGTELGLNRYDGARFITYDSLSITGNRINAIIEDNRGRIYVGTDECLCTYEPSNDTFSKIWNEKVSDILQTEDNLIFSSTNKIVVGDSTGMTEYESYDLGEVISIHSIKGHIYMVSRGGLFSFDGNNIRRIPVRGLDGIVISSEVFEDEIYLGVYQRGIFVVDTEGNIIKKFDRITDGVNIGVVCSIQSDIRRKRVWLGTDGDGLCILDSLGLRHFNPGTTGNFPNTVTEIYIDPFQNIYAGSSINGIYCIRPEAASFYGEHEMPCRTVTSICHDGTDVWVGTDGGGVVCYRPSDSTFRKFPSTHLRKISSLCEFDRQHLIISVYCEGVFLLDKKTGTLSRYDIWDEQTFRNEIESGSIITISPTPDGRFLVFARQTYILDPKTRDCKPFTSESNLSPTHLCFWKDGDAYARGGTGIYRLDLKDLKIHQINGSDNMPIHSAAMFNGELYYASNKGLFRRQLDCEQSYRVGAHLVKKVTHLTTDESGYLWIASDGALFRHDGKAFITYDESDGLIRNEVLCGVSSKDQVYFGGSMGLAEIKVNKSQTDTAVMSMHIDKVAINGKSIHQREGRYHYWGKSGALNVTYTISGSDPLKRRFLKFDVIKDGKPNEHFGRQLNIESLHKGTYCINGFFLGNDGLWHQSEDTLNLIIHTPAYASLWLWMIILTIIAGVIILFRLKKRDTSQTILLRPNIPILENTIEDSDEKMLLRFDELLEQNLGNEHLNVDMIVSGMAMSRTALYDKIKSLTGLGINEYILKVKMDKACRYLSETTMTISEIADQLGFSSQRYFSTAFKRSVGMSPSEFRKNRKFAE